MSNLKLMKTHAGCFGYLRDVVLFDLDKMTPEEAQVKAAKVKPDLFEGFDCESCGYDYPDWIENSEDTTEHTHSLDTCGHEPGYKEAEYQYDVENSLYGLRSIFCEIDVLFDYTPEDKDEVTIDLTR